MTNAAAHSYPTLTDASDTAILSPQGSNNHANAALASGQDTAPDSKPAGPTNQMLSSSSEEVVSSSKTDLAATWSSDKNVHDTDDANTAPDAARTLDGTASALLLHSSFSPTAEDESPIAADQGEVAADGMLPGAPSSPPSALALFPQAFNGQPAALLQPSEERHAADVSDAAPTDKAANPHIAHAVSVLQLFGYHLSRTDAWTDAASCLPNVIVAPKNHPSAVQRTLLS